jgi:hypothetical protein
MEEVIGSNPICSTTNFIQKGNMMERNSAKTFTPEQIAHYTETRIDDPVKAENVAGEGEAQAGYAAAIRDAVNILGLFQSGLITYDQLEERVDVHKGFNTIIDGPERLATSSMSTLLRSKRGGGGLEEYIAIMELAAEIEQKAADGVMDWAGVLYDHPISDSYREAHPELKFKRHPRETIHEAFEIWELSEHATEGLEVIREREEELKSIDTSRIWDEKKALDGWTIANLAEYSDTGKARLKDLLESSDTSLDDLKKFYTELFQAKVLNPQIEYIANVFNILEDIRSGKASVKDETSNPAAE